MADQDNYKTYVRETRTTESSGGSMALIVGGLLGLVLARKCAAATSSTSAV